ncbi:MAG TPA: response regulator transcription factor [Hyphomonadaceae bacterium]|nr:response regulator transcription factor [Hyphomonadaceae bacterium]
MTATAPKVLVVDDEAEILRVLKPSLAAAGYGVDTAGTGGDAIRQIAQDAPDVILLDLGLPDMDGKAVISALRAWTPAPIIVLSARHDELERIAALDNGADDYVTKPFRMGELQARVRAALRYGQQRKMASSSYSGLGLHIDFAERRVTVQGQEVKLTPKEYDLLRTLAVNAGKVVTHRQLLAAGWGTSVSDTQFVRVYVGQIRQKIEADPSAPRLLITEAGIGYRLRDEG